MMGMDGGLLVHRPAAWWRGLLGRELAPAPPEARQSPAPAEMMGTNLRRGDRPWSPAGGSGSVSVSPSESTSRAFEYVYEYEYEYDYEPSHVLSNNSG